jgi:hypothetical protein
VLDTEMGVYWFEWLRMGSNNTLFGDGSDGHCRFLWDVIITSLPNCVSSPVG